MNRLVLTLALALAAPLALPAAAQGVFVPPPPGIGDEAPELTGKRARIGQELSNYGFYPNMARLSDRQVALLDNTLHGGGSSGQTRARISSILNGGFLQRAIDGL